MSKVGEPNIDYLVYWLFYIMVRFKKGKSTVWFYSRECQWGVHIRRGRADSSGPQLLWRVAQNKECEGRRRHCPNSLRGIHGRCKLHSEFDNRTQIAANRSSYIVRYLFQNILEPSGAFRNILESYVTFKIFWTF